VCNRLNGARGMSWDAEKWVSFLEDKKALEELKDVFFDESGYLCKEYSDGTVICS